MVIATILRLSLKQLVVFSIFVLVKKLDRAYLMMISNAEKFRCTAMLCLRSITYCCYDNKSQKYMFSSKGLSKCALEDSGDGPMAKNRLVLDEAMNLK